MPTAIDRLGPPTPHVARIPIRSDMYAAAKLLIPCRLRDMAHADHACRRVRQATRTGTHGGIAQIEMTRRTEPNRAPGLSQDFPGGIGPNVRGSRLYLLRLPPEGG